MAWFQLTCLCSTNEFNKTLLLQNCTGALWGNMIQNFWITQRKAVSAIFAVQSH